jgi:hypothetical protein
MTPQTEVPPTMRTLERITLERPPSPSAINEMVETGYFAEA